MNLLEILIWLEGSDSETKARELVDKIANYYDENLMVSGETITLLYLMMLTKTGKGTSETTMSLLPKHQLQTIHERGKDSTDVYLQESTSAGERYPKAKTDFDRLDEGAVL